MDCIHRAGVVALLVWLWPHVGLAGQERDDAGANMPVRLGSIRLAPSIQIDGGVDSNVFNRFESPATDFRWTLSPRTEAAMRLGPARLSGLGVVDFVHYQRTASERSINLDGTLKLALPLNRLEPYASISSLRTRERPGVEIDARSLRHEQSVSVGVAARISGRSSLQFATTGSGVRFDADAVFLDTHLGDVLNRDATTFGVSVRHELTPLTTLTMAVDTTEERFLWSPVRDSRSLRVMPGFEFAASAVISGKASVGYRTLTARDASVPDFTGPAAAVDLAYTLLGSTRFVFQASHNLEYSYEAIDPYYVIAELGGSVIRRVSDSVGITARYSRSELTYRSIVSAISGGTARVENIASYGGGVFRKIGRELRVDLNIDFYQRHSPVGTRTFHSVLGGGSVIYGF